MMSARGRCDVLEASSMSTPARDPEGPAGDQEPATASIAPDQATSEPSPPRTPQTLSEGIKLIGGLIVVCAGLTVVALVAVVAMLLVKKTTSDVVAIATASFGVVGTIVGAYFGVKIGSDGTQAAVAGLRDEAAKAQAFAAHVPPEKAETAIANASALAGGSQSRSTAPASGTSTTRSGRRSR